jgi:hypothetical protein
MHACELRMTRRKWRAMRARVRTDPDYKRVDVCERWKTFEAFLEDMGPCPPGLTLERRDNNRGYEPGNCRWASTYEQGLNRSHVRFFEFQGRRLTLSDWARELGVNRGTLAVRYYKYKWPIERVLSEPIRRRRSCI